MALKLGNVYYLAVLPARDLAISTGFDILGVGTIIKTFSQCPERAEVLILSSFWLTKTLGRLEIMFHDRTFEEIGFIVLITGAEVGQVALVVREERFGDK